MKKSANDIYKILHQIGEGSYASVHKAINKETGELCAIKKIVYKPSEFTSLKNEIGILSDCECKNIVRFLDSAYIAGELSIFMEYCCGGSVKDVMRSLDRTLTQEQIIVIIKDVLKGLHYLHSKNITHRDVKAANILLDGDGVAKLGDFGVSEPSDTHPRKQTLIGTLLWLPPEVINKDCHYKPLIDIWSLGITIIEMAEGNPPYYDLRAEQALREISNITIPSKSFKELDRWSQQMVDFLALCLDKDASRRKTAIELLNYDIIKKSSSHDATKRLVEEVCSHVSGKDLHKKSRHLIMEYCILDDIHQKRRKNVLEVDALIRVMENLNENFVTTMQMNKKSYLIVKDMEEQLSQLVFEAHKMERDKIELEKSLANSVKHRNYLISELNKIGNRLKLNSLES